MRGLAQAQDFENIQMELGKTYQITYIVPDEELTDQKKLQEKLARIQTSIINSDDFKYVSSRLWGNTFTITVSLKKPKENMSGLGVLPLVALGLYVLGATVITALVGLGLKWTVSSVKEVSAPVVAVTQSLLPLGIIALLIYFAPHLSMLLPSRKR